MSRSSEVQLVLYTVFLWDVSVPDRRMAVSLRGRFSASNARHLLMICIGIDFDWTVLSVNEKT